MEIVFGRVLSFEVFLFKVLLNSSEERLFVLCRSVSEEDESSTSSSWESVDVVDSVDFLLNIASRFCLESNAKEGFLRLRALNPMSSTISYFSNPPQSAVEERSKTISYKQSNMIWTSRAQRALNMRVSKVTFTVFHEIQSQHHDKLRGSLIVKKQQQCRFVPFVVQLKLFRVWV